MAMRHDRPSAALARVLLHVEGMDALAQLPDDPALLKRMLVERDAVIAQRDAALAQVKEEAAQRIEAMRQKHQAELAALLRRIYGPRNERFDPTQLLLFGQRVDTMPLDEASIAEESGEPLTTRSPRPRNQHKHGRGKLPGDLPRIRIEHDLPEPAKKCPCCGNERHKIGEEVSEQLEYVPAAFKVLQHVRFKYACRQCETEALNPQIETAVKPSQPIEKGLAGPGLLAYIITSKLGDHLPLYRLEHIFARQAPGVDIARSTMCAWLAAAAELVTPLVKLMAQRVRGSKVIHTDDTTVPIQAPGTGRCRKGRIWCYLGDRANPYTVYDYTPDRTRAGPRNWLLNSGGNFRGYLQADAYGGYDGIYASGGGGVKEVACWAHARRKFFEAKDTDSRRSAQMLALVGELYAVETAAKAKIAALANATASGDGSGDGGDQADALRRELRQQQAMPILIRIRGWLDEQLPLVLPRSPMAGAITYTLNQWEALCRYTEQGFLAIDNNAAERALKRVAIGRKNWLFAGNDRAGGTAATLYSLIASAERHGLDPQRYLTGVLAHIASTPVSQVGRFLPDRWKADAWFTPTTSPGCSPDSP
jgi:transposase